MGARARASLVTILLLSGWGCATAAPPPDAAHPADLVMAMLERHLGQMDTSLDRLEKQLAQMQKLPDTTDPTLREIRALDLAGWQLHQQQWKLQREHFLFAQEQLRRAKAHPDEKARLLEQWTAHERDYERALDGFRQQRHELEQQRHKAEAQVVERYLR